MKEKELERKENLVKGPGRAEDEIHRTLNIAVVEEMKAFMIVESVLSSTETAIVKSSFGSWNPKRHALFSSSSNLMRSTVLFYHTLIICFLYSHLSIAESNVNVKCLYLKFDVDGHKVATIHSNSCTLERPQGTAISSGGRCCIVSGNGQRISGVPWQCNESHCSWDHHLLPINARRNRHYNSPCVAWWNAIESFWNGLEVTGTVLANCYGNFVTLSLPQLQIWTRIILSLFMLLHIERYPLVKIGHIMCVRAWSNV